MSLEIIPNSGTSYTAIYNVNDLVFIKNVLDTYVDISTSMKPIMKIDANLMVCKVTAIRSETTASGTSFYYSLKYNTPPTQKYSSLTDETTFDYMSESNLYSLIDGIALIEAKYADFLAYLNTL